jgi:HSP20 family protein
MEGTMANLSIRRGEAGRRETPTIWDPRRMMERMQVMDPFRLLHEMMSMDPFAGLVAPTGTMFAPDIEIRETKEAYKLTADLPGVSMEDLEINMTGNRLTVSGKREEEQREEDERFFAYERSYGTFSRSFVLPEGADVDNVKAELEGGVLRITVPKKAEMQPRRIEVGAAKETKEQPREVQQQVKETTGKKAA